MWHKDILNVRVLILISRGRPLLRLLLSVSSLQLRPHTAGTSSAPTSPPRSSMHRSTRSSTSSKSKDSKILLTHRPPTSSASARRCTASTKAAAVGSRPSATSSLPSVSKPCLATPASLFSGVRRRCKGGTSLDLPLHRQPPPRTRMHRACTRMHHACTRMQRARRRMHRT